MNQDISRAPKERVNIVYKSATAGASEEVELPLKILMLGDYTARPDETPLEERKAINVDKDNFGQVMQQQGLSVDIAVADKLSAQPEGAAHDPDAVLGLSLKFSSLKDFEPEGIVRQVAPMQQLLQLRAALNALKGPMGNSPAFRKKIQNLLGDAATRRQLCAELGLSDEDAAQNNAEDAS
jgi:type VI secretion system protein ImpB